MAKAPKDVGVMANRRDALAARMEFANAGGVLPYWRLPRTGHDFSQGAVFKTPEELWEAAAAYFQWAENNPIEHQDHVRVGGAVQSVTLRKQRPFHIRAFKVFAGISSQMWARLCSLEEFTAVIEEIENVIYLQKFDHAMVGVFDSGMTSKDLGLTDKKEISGPEGGPVEIESARAVLRERLSRKAE